MARVLITGGCGYVGSALYRYLMKQGHRCVSVDQLRRGNPADVPNIQMDFAMLVPDHLTGEGGPVDAVVHLAASATVQECNKNPFRAFYDNLVYPINLVDHLKGETLIYASSGSVHSRNGVSSVYDYTKRSLEQAMSLFYPQAVGLRFGTVCGPSPNIRGTMLNAMVEHGLRDGAVRVSNPSARRPILGIKDLCRAIEAQINNPIAGVHDLCTFNTTVGEAGEAVAAELGCAVRYDVPSSTYDFAMRCADWFQPLESRGSIISDLCDFYAVDPVQEMA